MVDKKNISKDFEIIPIKVSWAYIYHKLDDEGKRKFREKYKTKWFY